MSHQKDLTIQNYSAEYQLFREYIKQSGKIFLDFTDQNFNQIAQHSKSEKLLQKFFFDSQELVLILCKKETPGTEDPCEILVYLNIDEVNVQFGEAIVYFKKRDIAQEKVTQEKNYLQNAFNVL